MDARHIAHTAIALLVVLGLSIGRFAPVVQAQESEKLYLPLISTASPPAEDQILPAPVAGTVSGEPAAPVAPCSLYPIALHEQTLNGAVPGTVLSDILNGKKPGNFGWLTWTGNMGVPALVASLTPPGNSHTYTNPNDAVDHSISRGDWVIGRPGVANAQEIRRRLDVLKTLDIIVPVWNKTKMSDDRLLYQASDDDQLLYQVSGYARVRIVSYKLSSVNRLSVRYLGLAACEAPVAVHDVYALDEDETLTVAEPGVLANDRDADGDPLTAHLVQTTAHGTLVLEASGAFRYQPAANYFGPDEFVYQASDGTLVSDETQVSIEVSPVNDAPTAVNDAYVAAEDTPLTVPAPGVLANDTDVEQDALRAVLVAQPAHGTLTMQGDGAFVYRPDPDYYGPDSFTYQAGDGQLTSPAATVALSVAPGEDPPAAANDAYLIDEDKPLIVTAPGVLANDSDVDGDALTAVLVGEAAHGQVILSADGSFRYEPDANYHGPDSFTYRAYDSSMASNIATVEITVRSVNDAPEAVDDFYTVQRSQTLDVAAPGVLGNDHDIEASVLAASLLDGPSHGVLVLAGDGAFRYTPDTGFEGNDYFRYQANDGDKQSTPATVTILVEAAPNATPEVSPDTYAVDEDLALTVEATAGLLANDHDADGDPLTAMLDDLPGHGSVVVQSDGSFTYRAATNYYGPDRFTYRAHDGKAQSDPAVVTIEVRPINDRPVAGDDAYAVNEDQVLAVAAPGVLSTDRDVDGDVLTAVLQNGPAHGALLLTPAGAFIYTPTTDFHGTDAFTYWANDSFTDSVAATTVITVAPVNDTPVAVADNYRVYTGDVLTVSAPGVLVNDADADGDTLTATLVAGPSAGELVLKLSGAFVYTAPTDFIGASVFTYTAGDGQTTSSPVTVTITITANPYQPSDQGVIIGEVYNDATGLPLAGARIRLHARDGQVLSNPPLATSDAQGKYRLVSPPGTASLVITKPGHTEAYRTVTVVVGRATAPYDARLTPLAAGLQLPSIVGGTVTDAAGKATLTVPPFVLSADQQITVTRVSAQGLVGLLPPSWSPVAVVDIAPYDLQLNGAAALVVRAPVGLPAGSSLTVARWDETAHQWLALGSTAMSGDQIETPILTGGQVAFLLPDAPPNAPPTAVPGQPVAGSVPTMLPADFTVAIEPSPRILFTGAGAHADVTVRAAFSVAVPSGTPVQIGSREVYSLALGAHIKGADMRQDYTLFAFPGGAQRLAAGFPATPARNFAAYALKLGIIDLRAYLPVAVGAPVGTVLPPIGGRVATAEGLAVDVPSGASNEDLPVLLSRLREAEFPVPVPVGLTWVGGIDLDFHGAILAQPAALVLPFPVGFSGENPVLVVEVREVNQASQLVLVAVTTRQGDALVTATDPAGDGSLILPGIRSSGRYAFLQSAQPLGYITGIATTAAGQPLAGALVTADTMPITTVSDAAGRYTLLAPPGPVTVQALNPQTQDVVQTTGTVTLAAPLALGLTLAPTPPAVKAISPPDGASGVPLLSTVVVTFTEPLNRGSVTSGTLSLRSAGLVPGALSLSPDGRVLTFRPDGLLASQTMYSVTVAATVKDLAGQLMAAPFGSHFTSLDTTAPAPPPAGQISATIPDAAGFSTVRGTQGTVEPGGLVWVRNRTTGQVTALPVEENGSFSGQVQAQPAHKLEVVLRDAAGNETVVPVPSFRDPDGRVVVGVEGATVEGPGGVAVEIPPGALPDGTVVKVDPIAVDDLGLPPPPDFAFVAGVNLDLGGVVPALPLDLAVAAPANAASEDQVLVFQRVTLPIQSFWMLVDQAHFDGIRYVTASPPFPGVVAQAGYIFSRKYDQIIRSGPNNKLDTPLRGDDFDRAQIGEAPIIVPGPNGKLDSLPPLGDDFVNDDCVSYASSQVQLHVAQFLVVPPTAGMTLYGAFSPPTVSGSVSFFPARCNVPVQIRLVDPDTGEHLRTVEEDAPSLPGEYVPPEKPLTDDNTRPEPVDADLPFQLGNDLNKLRIQFSEPMDGNSMDDLRVETGLGIDIAGSVTMLSAREFPVYEPVTKTRALSNAAAVFRPQVPFQLGMTYVVTYSYPVPRVLEGVTDRAGNVVAGNTVRFQPHEPLWLSLLNRVALEHISLAGNCATSLNYVNKNRNNTYDLASIGDTLFIVTTGPDYPDDGDYRLLAVSVSDPGSPKAIGCYKGFPGMRAIAPMPDAIFTAKDLDEAVEDVGREVLFEVTLPVTETITSGLAPGLIVTPTDQLDHGEVPLRLYEALRVQGYPLTQAAPLVPVHPGNRWQIHDGDRLFFVEIVRTSPHETILEVAKGRDFLVATGGGEGGSATWVYGQLISASSPAMLEIYDVTACTRRPVVESNCLAPAGQKILKGTKFLTDPDGAIASWKIPKESGIAADVAVQQWRATSGATTGAMAYVVTHGIGLQAVDITRAFNGGWPEPDPVTGKYPRDITPTDWLRYHVAPDGLQRGTFYDIAFIHGWVLAAEERTTEPRAVLSILDPNLVEYRRIPVSRAFRVTAAPDMRFDVNDDGALSKAEAYDLAVVSSGRLVEGTQEHSELYVIDLSWLRTSTETHPLAGQIPGPLATIRLSVRTRNVQLDTKARIVYTELPGQSALALVDLGHLLPVFQGKGYIFNDLPDRDGNGVDDRIVYTIRTSGARSEKTLVDPARGIAYIHSYGRGIDIYSFFPVRVHNGRSTKTDLISTPPRHEPVLYSRVERVGRATPVVTETGDQLCFDLPHPARVTVSINGKAIRQDELFQMGANCLDIPRKEVGIQGQHSYTDTAGAVLAGLTECDPRPQHTYQIVAVFGSNVTTTVGGTIYHHWVLDDNLPVGHTMVKGVNLWNGQLYQAAEDVRIPGRGPALVFSRSYGSSGDDDEGPLGAGWTHNYDVRLLKLDQDRYMVIGGEGTGNTFTATNTLTGTIFTPQIGYHSTLIQDPNNADVFDFFTKARIQYHFVREWAIRTATVFTLRYMSDATGNGIQLEYDLTAPEGDGDPTTLDRIREVQFRDGQMVWGRSARALLLDYQYIYGAKRIVELTAPLSLTVSYNYDEWGNLVEVRRDSRVETYAYSVDSTNDRHNLVSYTDPNGHSEAYLDPSDFQPSHTISYTYGLANASSSCPVVTQIVEDPAGSNNPGGAHLTTDFDYSLESSQRTVTAPGDRETIYTLNDYGAVEKVEAPLGRKTTTLWCTGGSHLGGSGQNSTDGELPEECGGRIDVLPVREIDALERIHSMRYDEQGNLIQDTFLFDQISGSEIRDVTDAFGNPVKLVTTTYRYEPTFSQVISQTDAEGHTTTFLIDADYQGKEGSLIDCPDSTAGDTGKILGVRDPAGNQTCYGYASNGDLLSVTDPMGRITRYTEYDDYGNPLHIAAPEGKTIDNTYDVRSRMLSTHDSLGHRTTYGYDGLDRVRVETKYKGADASGADEIIRYTYLPNGEVATVEDGLKQTTYYRYDGLNRLVDIIEKGVAQVDGTAVDLITAHKAYDDAGNLWKETDGRGVTKTHYYDDLDQLLYTQIDGPFGGPVGSTNLVSYTYDVVGNRLTETDLHAYTTQYVYDGLYRVVEAGLPIIHTFSDVPWQQAMIQTVYDREGNKLGETDANGYLTTYRYDTLNRLVEETDAVSNTITYTYDPTGNVLSEKHQSTGLLSGYSYDDLDRVLAVTQTVPLGGPNLATAVYVTRYVYEDAANAVVVTDPRGIKTRTDKDGLDRVFETTVDVGGLNLITGNTYDSNGNLVTVSDPQNGDIDLTHEYDGLDRKIRTTYVATPGDGGSTVTEEFTYDGNGNQIRHVDKRGIVYTGTFDNLNRERTLSIVETISNGGTPLLLSESQYGDQPGTDGLYSVTTFDANRNRTITYYEALGRPTRIDDPDPSGLVVYAYDGVNKRQEIDKRGQRTTYTYDAINRLLVTQEYDQVGALQTTAAVAYDDENNRVTETDRRGVETVSQIDALGRLVQLKRRGLDMADHYGASEILLETHAYDGNGNQVAFVDGQGNRTEYVYDGADRQIKVVEGAGSPVEAATTSTYDAVGNLLTVKDGRAHGGDFDVQYTYDAQYRKISETNGEGETTTYAYDANDNLIEMGEPKGAAYKTLYRYDELNTLLAVDETPRIAAGHTTAGVTRFFYDGNRNKIAQQDANGNLVTYQYDGLNQLTATFQHTVAGALDDATLRGADPRGGDLAPGGDLSTALRWQYAYDLNGNQTQILDAMGQQVELTYDYLDRLASRSYSNHADPSLDFQVQSIAYAYDANGNTVAVTETKRLADALVTELTAYRYDPLDRVQSTTRRDYDGAAKTIAYDYDRTGNRTAVVDSDSISTTYTYDARNRLATVTTAAGTTTYGWWEDGLLKWIGYSDYTVHDRSFADAYDRADRIRRLENRRIGPVISAYSTYTYAYDASGNRLRQVETQQALDGGQAMITTYGYDALDHLLQVTYGPAGGVTYSYDAVGNRLTEQGTDPSTAQVVSRTYTYDHVNALTRMEDGLDANQNVTYAYDGNLNQVAKSRGGQRTEYHYNIRDQMVEADVNGVRTTFDYNADGMRVKKIGAGGEIRYLYDDEAVLVEYGGTPTGHATTQKYNYGYALHSLEIVTAQGRQTQYYLQDALGSTANLANANGDLTQSYRYDAWGQVTEQTGTTASNMRRYTGHYYDAETELQYFGARYYDGETGRFLSQDPYSGEIDTPPSLHRYLYAYSNPLRWVDLTGYAVQEANNESFLDFMRKQVTSGVVEQQILTYASGLGQGFVAGAEGTLDMVAHPIDTITGMLNAVVNYEETIAGLASQASAFVSTYTNAAQKDPVQFSEMTGEIVGRIGYEIATSKGSKALRAVMKSSAEAGVKATISKALMAKAVTLEARTVRAIEAIELKVPGKTGIVVEGGRLASASSSIYRASLQERLVAYKAWKHSAGIANTPTLKEFRRFQGAHRPTSLGKTLYPDNNWDFAKWAKRMDKTVNRLSRAQHGTREHAMIARALRPLEGQYLGEGWQLAAVERTVGGTKRVDALYINHIRKRFIVEDYYTGRVESTAHKFKGWAYMKERHLRRLIQQGYEPIYAASIKHPELLN